MMGDDQDDIQPEGSEPDIEAGLGAISDALDDAALVLGDEELTSRLATDDDNMHLQTENQCLQASLDRAESMLEILTCLGKELIGGSDKLVEEVEHLRGRLAYYADTENWECPRCHGHDWLNCGLTRWIGPGEHGYSIAHGDLKATRNQSAMLDAAKENGADV